MPVLARFQTRRIFEALTAMHRAGGEFRYPEFEARLEESERTLMASIVFADTTSDEMVLLKQAEACLEAAEQQESQAVENELRSRIDSALRAGDHAEATRLTEQWDHMKRAARGGRG